MTAAPQMRRLALALAALCFAQTVSAQGLQQRVIVKYKSASAAAELRGKGRTAAIDHAGRAHGLNAAFMRTLGTGAELVALDKRLDAAAMRGYLAAIAADPQVEYVEEDRVLQADATPNDSRYNEQWHYFEPAGGIRADTAWDTTTGSGVVVAVLDTGYRPHADLVGNIVGGYDMISDATVGNDGNGRDSDAQDPGDWTTAGQCGTGSAARNSSWHGTHVAGTVAAVTNNGSGVAGVAYGAKVVPVRVLGRCGGYTSDIADGIIWASGGTVSGVPANANPAKVINMSLGGSGSCDATSQAAINSARSRGTTVVVTAGNANKDASTQSPASCSGVVVVAAVNRSGGKAPYSNFGSIVDIAAPGGSMTSSTDPNGVLSTYNAGTTVPAADSYGFAQGTSMAAPHIAGVAALMYAVKPTITPDQVEAALKSSSRAFPATCSQCGSGIADAPAAITAAAAVGSGSGGGTGACPTGYTTYTGNFTATGQNLYAPNTTGFRPSANGSLLATLAGPTGTDFDLYLQRRANNGSWSQVAASETATSSESINYASGSNKQTYRWRVASYAGTGSFTLCTKAP